jgi:putative heme iron utilization protein
MSQKADFDAPKLVRGLLRRSRQGALATLMTGSGDPYCSLVNVASGPTGVPILLISRLALHTKNCLADPRVSLMLDERRAGDPLEGARVMLSGVAEPAQSDTIAVLRRRYLAAHPDADVFVDFADFVFVTIRLMSIHLVAGFGRIIDLTPLDVLTDVTGAETLLDAEVEILAHINTDHRATLSLYATKLLGAEAGDWCCTGCDPDGLDLRKDRQTLRLDFPQRIVTPGALRKTLKELADHARSF